MLQSQSLQRTQIYLPSAQIGALAVIARQQRSSNSALIRQAIDAYLARSQPAAKQSARQAAAGAWAANPHFDLGHLRSEERRF